MMKLIEAIRNLDALDDDSTIYAAEPWTPNSEAIVAREPKSGSLPAEAERLGLKYFLEVSIARDFLEDLQRNGDPQPTLQQKLARIVRYASTDS